MEANTKLINVVELIDESKMDVMSATLNPNVTFVEFVLLDDQPNGNNMVVPQTEFDNIIKTGLYMPIKMAEGEIKPGHDNSIPLGVITNLKKEGNRILGLAALWLKERFNDINFIKEAYANKKPLNISWELNALQNKDEESGIITLQDVVMNAATLVGMPAYEGRTPVLALAAKETEQENVNMEELETLKQTVSELTSKLESANTEIASLKEKLTGQEAELGELKQYKASIEEAEAQEAKLENIKQKFATASLDMGEDYFTEKRETLLSMADEAVDFMIQEIVSFSQKIEASKLPKETKTTVPNVTSVKSEPTVKDLAKQFRDLK